MPNLTTNAIEVYSQTWKWLHAQRAHFAIAPFRDSERLLDLVKPISELALLCQLIKRFPLSAAHEEADNALRFCWDQLGHGDLIAEILCARPDLIILTSLYATFKEAGRCNERLERQIGLMVATPAYFNADLPAWRRMDLMHGLWQLGLNGREAILNVYDGTWAAGNYPTWTISEAAAYGLTHAIFYATDYGAYPDSFPKENAIYLRDALPVWEAYYLREGNFDLAAEMVMSRYCIGDRYGCETFAERALVGCLDNGEIPGPKFGAVNLLYGEHDPIRHKFLQNYHTTLVTCIACAMMTSATP